MSSLQTVWQFVELGRAGYLYVLGNIRNSRQISDDFDDK